MKFIHLTDFHLVAPGRTLYGRDPAGMLERAIEHINHEHGDAVMVVVTGDLTEAAEPEAYRVSADLLDRLRMPCHVIPGNHDRRQPFFEAFPHVAVDRNGFRQEVIDTPAGVFLLLDTVNEGASAGRLCDSRLDWLATHLEATRGRSVFVFMHHPPFDVGIPSMDLRGLDNRERLLSLLAGHGDVRHIFFGHIHRPLHGTWRGIGYSAQVSLSHQVAFIDEPGERTAATLEPPAYSVVTVIDDRVQVHAAAFADDSPWFDLRDPLAIAASSTAMLPPYRRSGS